MKICSDSVHRAIDGELHHMQMTQTQKQAILAQCRPSVTVRRSHASVFKRIAATAAAAAIFTVCGAGVLASSPGLADKLSMLGQHALTQMKPIEMAAESGGIRMEVLAAMNDEDVAAVYLTLQDVTGQGRVREDLELRDLTLSGADMTAAQVISYDEASDTATLHLTGEGGQLAGHKVSVTLRSFLTGWDYETRQAGLLPEFLGSLGLPPPQTRTDAKIAEVYSSDFALDPRAVLDGSIPVPVLQPSGEGAPLAGAPWAEITAAGVVDGVLHLQVLQDEELGPYNQIDFFLTDAAGNTLSTPVTVLGLDHKVNIAPDWDVYRLKEYLLPLPEDLSPDSIRLEYGLSAYEACSQGVWSVAFQLEPPGRVLTIPCSWQRDGWTLEQVEISALGVTLRGRGNTSNLTDLPYITAVRRDGTTAEFFSSSSSFSNGRITCKQLFQRPLDLDQLARLTLDDVPLPLPETQP